MDQLEWEHRAVPDQIRLDPLWTAQAYRLSLFACDVGWEDITRLARERRTQAMASQLYRALGSIGATYAEGYSRPAGPDRARFYGYSLGSARESRDWYFKARHVLDGETVSDRLDRLTQIVRLLLVTIPRERRTRRPGDTRQ